MNLREEEVRIRERRFVKYRFARASLGLPESTHRVQHPGQGKVAVSIDGVELNTVANGCLRLGKLIPVAENHAQPKMRRGKGPPTHFDRLAKCRFRTVPTLHAQLSYAEPAVSFVERWERLDCALEVGDAAGPVGGVESPHTLVLSLSGFFRDN